MIAHVPTVCLAFSKEGQQPSWCASETTYEARHAQCACAPNLTSVCLRMLQGSAVLHRVQRVSLLVDHACGRQDSSVCWCRLWCRRCWDVLQGPVQLKQHTTDAAVFKFIMFCWGKMLPRCVRIANILVSPHRALQHYLVEHLSPKQFYQICIPHT